jgi:hypothetical protein
LNVGGLPMGLEIATTDAERQPVETIRSRRHGYFYHRRRRRVQRWYK